MDNLYEIIENLCAEKKITVAALTREVGISKSTMTELKKGRSQSLSAKNLEKIAKYFGVTIDYLLGKETDNKKSPTQEGEAKFSDMTIKIMEKLNSLPEDKQQLALDFLEVLVNKNKK